MDLWVQPLLLIPGVGLLILSTSVRYQQIDVDLREFSLHPQLCDHMQADRLLRRARYFRDVLVSLYLAAALLAIAALIALMVEIRVFPPSAEWVGLGTICLAIAAIAFATVQLIREATMSMEIVSHLVAVLRRDASNSED